MYDYTKAVYSNSGVGTHTFKSLVDYAKLGYAPGGFLNAVICNDLTESINRADHRNLHGITAIAAFVYNELPAECWGSPEKVQAWYKKIQDAKAKGASS